MMKDGTKTEIFGPNWNMTEVMLGNHLIKLAETVLDHDVVLPSESEAIMTSVTQHQAPMPFMLAQGGIFMMQGYIASYMKVTNKVQSCMTLFGLQTCETTVEEMWCGNYAF